MKDFKLGEKKFLETAILSNVNGLVSGQWFNNGNNKEIVKWSIDLALETLKQRNELFESSEKIKTTKKDILNVNFDEIICIFNQICFKLPTATKCTFEREKAIVKILENYTLEDIGIVFKNTSESDYLIGNIKNWKADIDWVLNPKNFIRILENKFKNIENGNTEKGKYTGSDALKTKIAERLFSKELP